VIDAIDRDDAAVGRELIMRSIPLAALAVVMQMTQLYVVVLLVRLLNVFYSVADESYLPAVVTRDKLGEANARIGASDSVAEVAGSSLGGVLLQ
jgi:hypothetical protein